MFTPMQYLQSQLQNNPNIANNPQAQNFIQVLQSGNAQMGQQIAENILKAYGMTKEQGMAQARQFFHF